MKIIDKLKKISISKRKQTIIILSIIFLMMLVLNLLTPLIADDYSYSLNIDDEVISSIMDIIKYQWWHYFNWGGRTVAHSMAQFFLLLPKEIFSFLNAFMYTSLIYLIYIHVKGKNKEEKPIFLILIHLGLWFLLSAFGQTCLWLTGSCNYLWTSVFILLFLFIIRRNSKDTIIKILAMFLFGIICGWTNENTAFGLIIITLGILILNKINKKDFKKYQLSGLVGAVLGFILLILAPGNYVRSDILDENTFFLIKYGNRALEYTVSFIEEALPLFILLIVLISIYIYNKKKINKVVYLFILGGLLTNYAMVLSPTFPDRAYTGVIIFLLIATLQLVYNLDNLSKIYKVIIIDTTLILSIIFISDYINTFKETLELYRVWDYRVTYIEKEKEKGNYDIEVGPFSPTNRHTPSYGLSDITGDIDNWLNEVIEDYFDIDSIKTVY